MERENVERFCLYLGFIVLEGKWGKKERELKQLTELYLYRIRGGGKEKRERWR